MIVPGLAVRITGHRNHIKSTCIDIIYVHVCLGSRA